MKRLVALLILTGCISSHPPADRVEGEIPATVVDVRRERSREGDLSYSLTVEYTEPGGATIHRTFSDIPPRMFVHWTSREICVAQRIDGPTLIDCRK